MSYVKATLIADIRRILNDAPSQDICVEAMDTTETGLDVADGTLYAAGGLVEFQDDGEVCLITSITGNTLTVVRNYNFSISTTAGTGTSHSINAAILREPTFPYRHISDSISSSIAGLWPYVYREVNDTITPVSGTKLYNATATTVATLTALTNAATSVVTTSAAHGFSVGDVVTIAGTTPTTYNGTWVISAVTSTTFSIFVGAALGAGTVFGTATRVDPTELLELSSVTQVTTASPASVWFYGVNRGAYPVEIMFNAPTSIAASGTAYVVPYLNNTTNAINVNGIGKVTDTVSAGAYTDLSAGFQADCVAYYTVSRLIGSTDISRTTAEDIGMGDKTVASGSRTRLASYWEDKGLAERNKWKMELDITLPRMKKWGHF